MKNHDIQLIFVVCLFAALGALLGWCSNVVALLIVIQQLLVLVIILLSRIYNIIKDSADLRSESKTKNH